MIHNWHEAICQSFQWVCHLWRFLIWATWGNRPGRHLVRDLAVVVGWDGEEGVSIPTPQWCHIYRCQSSTTECFICTTKNKENKKNEAGFFCCFFSQIQFLYLSVSINLTSFCSSNNCMCVCVCVWNGCRARSGQVPRSRRPLRLDAAVLAEWLPSAFEFSPVISYVQTVHIHFYTHHIIVAMWAEEKENFKTYQNCDTSLGSMLNASTDSVHKRTVHTHDTRAYKRDLTLCLFFLLFSLFTQNTFYTNIYSKLLSFFFFRRRASAETDGSVGAACGWRLTLQLLTLCTNSTFVFCHLFLFRPFTWNSNMTTCRQRGEEKKKRKSQKTNKQKKTKLIGIPCRNLHKFMFYCSK